MSADALLSHLDRVKKTGHGRWVAQCPGHESRSKCSLTVRELDDGRVLIHDFGGCSPDQILSAVGLTMEALFPERTEQHHYRGERRPFSAADALRCVAYEATFVAVAASNIAQGMAMSEEERLRLHTAAGRINYALEVALG